MQEDFVGGFRVYNGRTKTEPFEGYDGPIVQYHLEHEAATEWAASILPSALVSTLDFSTGAWAAPLPEATPQDIANKFGGGVLPEPPVSEWQAFDPDHYGPEMSKRMASSLGCAPSDLVVVPKQSLVLYAAQWAIDHIGSSPSAVALVREMNPWCVQAAVKWTTAMGVLYPVAGASWNRDSVADLMDMAADSSSEFMILTSTDRLDTSTSHSLPDSDLAELVARADSIAIGAYDGEGYVRWSRTRTVEHADRADGQQR